MMHKQMLNDDAYMQIFLEPIEKCRMYKPKLGQSTNDEGITLSLFKTLYGSDPLYHWIGLDSDLMYAAHKAAGGMTSVYRQLGVSCERLFRQIILDTVGYRDTDFVTWSYQANKTIMKNNKPTIATKTLTLDARLEINAINNDEIKNKLINWLQGYCARIDANVPENGVVFEIRQGYKSKDSKRQNSDIENSSIAWSKGYLPIFGIFSTQIDESIANRYINSRAGILVGSQDDNPYTSLFAFTNSILGYDLAGFFERNSSHLRAEMQNILNELLRA